MYRDRKLKHISTVEINYIHKKEKKHDDRSERIPKYRLYDFIERIE